MTAESIIVCENLVKIYRIEGLEVQALQGLDLSVAEGELLGIVGSSGSGKSTLLNILGGLDRPTGGRAWVANNDLLNLEQSALDRYRKSTVGFVWQQGSRNLIPYLTAEENVRLPLTLSGRTGNGARKRADELLEIVGLSDRKHHHMEQLSGGEQQRIAIAVALANQPKLLLADEPTGELDNATAKTIYETFRRLNEQLGLTIVIVSHDPSIARVVDRVVAVRDGKLASETVRVTAPTEDQTGIDKYHEMVVLELSRTAAGAQRIPGKIRYQAPRHP